MSGHLVSDLPVLPDWLLCVGSWLFFLIYFGGMSLFFSFLLFRAIDLFRR